MATTIPTTFTGTPTISAAKVAQLVDWYELNLRDSDKAAEGYDRGYYTGTTEAFEIALQLIHSNEPTTFHAVEAEQGDTMNTPTIFIEVRGGVIDDVTPSNSAGNVEVVKIDWDDLEVDESYAEQAAFDVRNSGMEREVKQRIYDAIEAVWPGTTTKNREYTVQWEIQLTADSHRDAGKRALEILRDHSPQNIGLGFIVLDDMGTTRAVDLSPGAGTEDVDLSTDH